MALKFNTSTILPGAIIKEMSISLVEIRPPSSITFWYDRTTERAVEQQHITLSLDAMKAKYPAEYAAVFRALQKVGYAEAVDGGLAPSGGTVT